MTNSSSHFLVPGKLYMAIECTQQMMVLEGRNMGPGGIGGSWLRVPVGELFMYVKSISNYGVILRSSGQLSYLSTMSVSLAHHLCVRKTP